MECYDLVLLDLNLPKKDGMTVLRTLRQTDRETRVLILSARSEVEDKVQGLDAGAKRLSGKALSSCRAGGPHPQPDIAAVHPAGCVAKLRSLTFDTRSRTAAVNGQTLTLDRKERDTRIPDGASGAARESGGADGSRLGQQRGRLQQFHSRPHLRPAQKLRAVLGYDPIRNRIGEGYLMGGEEE